MRDAPSLTHHQTFFDPTDMARYAAIVAAAEVRLGELAPGLQALVRPFLASLVQGEFCQIAVLLPYWLADVLPLPPAQLDALAAAHLDGWWYYAVQDALLDGQVEAGALLGGHLALVRMIDAYRRLGLQDTPCWREFTALTTTSAEGYADEWGSRFTALAELTPERLAPWTPELIVRRSSPFFFNTCAQLQLAGEDPQGPLGRDLLLALRSLCVARQLVDDAHDWPDDLAAGQLNVVSASLLRRMHERGLADGGLDRERVLGYQVDDEPFWAELEATANTAGEVALAGLMRHGGARLATLVRHQLARNAIYWAAARSERARWRRLFGAPADAPA